MPELRDRGVTADVTMKPTAVKTVVVMIGVTSVRIAMPAAPSTCRVVLKVSMGVIKMRKSAAANDAHRVLSEAGISTFSSRAVRPA